MFPFLLRFSLRTVYFFFRSRTEICDPSLVSSLSELSYAIINLVDVDVAGDDDNGTAVESALLYIPRCSFPHLARFGYLLLTGQSVFRPLGSMIKIYSPFLHSSRASKVKIF